MVHLYNRFLSDETGAITVDWVVMTAALVGLGLAGITAVRTGSAHVADETGRALGSAQLAALDIMETGGGTAWEYTGFTRSVASMNGPGGLVETLTASDRTLEELQRSYTGHAREVGIFVAEDHTEMAGMNADVLYALERAIQNRNGTIPSGVMTVQAAHMAVSAM